MLDGLMSAVHPDEDKIAESRQLVEQLRALTEQRAEG